MSEENPKFEQQKEQLIRTLATMFDYLGLNGTFRVEMRDERISVKIASEDAGRVIGRKGQTLESLQLLANRANTTVAEMVNIVNCTDIVCKTVHIVN